MNSYVKLKNSDDFFVVDVNKKFIKYKNKYYDFDKNISDKDIVRWCKFRFNPLTKIKFIITILSILILHLIPMLIFFYEFHGMVYTTLFIPDKYLYIPGITVEILAQEFGILPGIFLILSMLSMVYYATYIIIKAPPISRFSELKYKKLKKIDVIAPYLECPKCEYTRHTRSYRENKGNNFTFFCLNCGNTENYDLTFYEASEKNTLNFYKPVIAILSFLPITIFSILYGVLFVVFITKLIIGLLLILLFLVGATYPLFYHYLID